MSSDSLALFREGLSKDLRKLAEQHLQHDLTQADRDTLDASASKLSTHVTIGSLVGMGLGIALAWRVRSNRLKVFNAFRATQRPTHVKFADGREGSTPLPPSTPGRLTHLLVIELIPDITPLMQPSTAGDIAAYTFFSIAGLFLGGETGLLTGASAAKRTITKDPETRARIEKAFKGFRADMLRKEIEVLETGKGDYGIWGESV